MNCILKILAVIGLFLISPLIIVSSFIIFLEDGIPIFFIQERIGKNEKIFKLFKIRTMLKNTPNIGTHQINNNQLLKTGMILRKLKIDELPQILNFIFGDLNLVGPRPGLTSQKELFNYRKSKNVFFIKPGITGLGQVLGYDMSNPKLLAEIDNLYMLNKSTFLDLNIFFATFFNFFRVKLKKKFNKDIGLISK